MLDQVEKLELYFAIVDEVDVIWFIAYIIDNLSWLKSLDLEMFTDVDDFSQRPVSHDWNFL